MNLETYINLGGGVEGKVLKKMLKIGTVIKVIQLLQRTLEKRNKDSDLNKINYFSDCSSFF